MPQAIHPEGFDAAGARTNGIPSPAYEKVVSKHRRPSLRYYGYCKRDSAHPIDGAMSNVQQGMSNVQVDGNGNGVGNGVGWRLVFIVDPVSHPVAGRWNYSLA